MDNRTHQRFVNFQLDHAKKPRRKWDWRGMAMTVAVIAAFLGLVAIEIYVMGGHYEY